MQPTFTRPTWYKPRGDTPLDSITNAILPYMSAEDRNVTARKLGTSSPTNLGTYRTAELAQAPARITSDIRRQFLSADRAQKTLNSLRNMQNVTQYTDAQLGVGFKYLQDVVGTLQRIGGSGRGGMTRAQFQELSTAVEGLSNAYLADAPAEAIAPYSSLAKAIADPTFSAGKLVNTRTSGTRIMAGVPHPKLYG